MNTKNLSQEIRRRSEELSDRWQNEDGPLPIEKREAIDHAELLLVLARVLEGKTLARAFGAPGDWGYCHPIGKALAAAPEREPAGFCVWCNAPYFNGDPTYANPATREVHCTRKCSDEHDANL